MKGNFTDAFWMWLKMSFETAVKMIFSIWLKPEYSNRKYPHLNLGNWNRIFKTQTRLGKHNDIQISNVCLHNLFNTKQFIFLSSSNLKRAFNLSGICISNFMRLNFIRALKGSFWCLSNAKYNIVGNNKQEKNIISWF